jgi:hypothetical protein
VDDLKGMLDNAHSHELLAIVPTVHHHGVSETLHDGALCFAEALGGIAPCTVGQVLGILLFDCNIILEQQEKECEGSVRSRIGRPQPGTRVAHSR